MLVMPLANNPKMDRNVGFRRKTEIEDRQKTSEFPKNKPRVQEGLAGAQGETTVPEKYHMHQAVQAGGNEQDSYSTKSEKRGQAFVIRNIQPKNTDLIPSPAKDPKGVGRDDKALLKLLPLLGLVVELQNNLTCEQMKTAIVDFAKNKAHAECDMAVLVVLTPGGSNVMLGVDSKPLNVEDVIGYFSDAAAPLLAGKPKWLVFQLYSGLEKNCEQASEDDNMQADDDMMQNIPVFRDMYLTFSTIPGEDNYLFKNGFTLLEQVMSEVFAEFACNHELHELLMIVLNRINKRKQVKQFIRTSQRGWCKGLYFNSGLNA